MAVVFREDHTASNPAPRALRVPRTGGGPDGFVPMRTRTHGGVTARTTVIGARPMIRSTIGIQASPTPLKVVTPLRRRTARLVAVGFAVIFVLMLGAAAFQTQLAKRQVTLDQVDTEIRDQTDQYNRLRGERAELRAPERLATEATKLGMQPTAATAFVSISPEIVAEVLRSSGGVFDANATVGSTLDEFMQVKAIAGTNP
jgi:cell division protein FtsL